MHLAQSAVTIALALALVAPIAAAAHPGEPPEEEDGYYVRVGVQPASRPHEYTPEKDCSAKRDDLGERPPSVIYGLLTNPPYPRPNGSIANAPDCTWQGVDDPCQPWGWCFGLPVNGHVAYELSSGNYSLFLYSTWIPLSVATAAGASGTAPATAEFDCLECPNPV